MLKNQLIEYIKALIELWKLASIDGTEYGITLKELNKGDKR